MGTSLQYMESLHGNQQPYFTRMCPREEELAVAEQGGAAASELRQTQVAELGCMIPWRQPLGPSQCRETVEAMKRGLAVNSGRTSTKMEGWNRAMKC